MGNRWLVSAYRIILKHLYMVKVLVWNAEVLISCRLLLRFYVITKLALARWFYDKCKLHSCRETR